MNEKFVSTLTEHLKRESAISMAFLFGSYVKGFYTRDSDIDVAIYFEPGSRVLEWEEGRKSYPDESRIWREIEILANINVDLIVMNKVPSTIAFEILKRGVPLLIRNKNIYWDFYLIVSTEAEDFREFIKDYRRIYLRSRSIEDVDKARLIERIHFLDLEVQEFCAFSLFDQKTYYENKLQRRNIERWVETLINASIDIAKIILATQKREMPSTYSDVLLNFAFLVGFEDEDANKFADFAKLRNILAHEYLDIRFVKIQEFINNAEPFYLRIIEYINRLLEEPSSTPGVTTPGVIV